MVMNDYMKYIALSRYARWLPEQGRRETWNETVGRYVKHFSSKYPQFAEKLETEIQPAIEQLAVMPSMRMLMTAGAALDKDNVAGYNCAYLAVDTPRAFDETMYVLMCGTGVGFSVERQYVNQLPTVAEEFHPSETTIVVPDSKIGWATSYRELVAMLYSGKVPKWDMSKIRPAGAPLKTFGGRASGSKPLNDLFNFTVKVMKGSAGRKLSSIECHDIMCKIADIVVVGGVRRSALISLSNLTDDRMRHAKSGQWWVDNNQRALANNSVAYTEKPDMEAFMREWLALVESKSGERGIFYRGAAENLIPERRKKSEYKDYGCNVHRGGNYQAVGVFDLLQQVDDFRAVEACVQQVLGRKVANLVTHHFNALLVEPAFGVIQQHARAGTLAWASSECHDQHLGVSLNEYVQFAVSVFA